MALSSFPPLLLGQHGISCWVTSTLGRTRYCLIGHLWTLDVSFRHLWYQCFFKETRTSQTFNLSSLTGLKYIFHDFPQWQLSLGMLCLSVLLQNPSLRPGSVRKQCIEIETHKERRGEGQKGSESMCCFSTSNCIFFYWKWLRVTRWIGERARFIRNRQRALGGLLEATN